MDVSLEITETGCHNQIFPVDNEEEDLCRICRSPEEPGNPLRYPCLCRGSIKYVHEDCLRTWLNLRGHKNCEVCRRSYSFVPVYSENAPEILSCNEFLLGVLSRLGRYLKLMVPWIVVILMNSYFVSFHPWSQELVAEFQSFYGMSRKLAYLSTSLLHSASIVSLMTVITVIRLEVGDVYLMRFIGNGVVVQFLWKYIKILCDWCAHKAIYFLGPFNYPIHVPPHPPLHEFGVIRRLLFFFDDDDAFAVLAISVCVSTLFILLPFSIGWVVLAAAGDCYLSGEPPINIGYMMILSIAFAYFGILFILNQSRWLSLGFHFMLAFLVKACKNMFFIKDAFVLCLKFGAFPWIVGWFLRICTSPMFGTIALPIFEFFSHSPCLMMAIRWLFGIYCLLTAGHYMQHIQKIVHKRAFWYLLDVTDPNYKMTKMNFGHSFFALASHGVLFVVLFRLPIKAITLISPSFFPLDLWITDENPFIGWYPIYYIVMHAGLTWLLKFTRPAINLILDKWIITVSSWLQLSDFLLVVPRGEGMMRPRRPYNDWFVLYSLAEGAMVTFYKSHNAEEQRHKRYRTRLAVMLLLAALSLFLVSTTFMALPILVGRVFSYSISFFLLRYGIKHDDLCAFWIGCYILRALYISLCFAFDRIWKGRTDLLLKYILIRIRKALLFSIWISIIPGLLGLLIDLMIIIPLRVPPNETPIYFLIQDWLIGVVVLHSWIFLTMGTPIKCFATNAWRRKFERVENVGINRLPLMWLLRDVIGSIVNTLLTALSIPYVLVKFLLPLLGFSQSVNAAVERFIWPASLALIVVWFMIKLTLEIIIYLHKLIFNERYMVGERVGDLTEDL